MSRCRLIRSGLVLWALVASASHGLAAELTWTVGQADCNYVLQAHERDANVPGGPPIEYVRLRAGAGTYVYLHQAAGPARLIDDLQVRLTVKSSRRGVQLLGRIVFPHTVDPQTGEPATVLVPGESYQHVGQWQRLTIDEIPRAMQRQLRVLRAKQPVNARDAYLDGIVLNGYGGPGTTEVWLGELEQLGVVAPPDAATARIGQVAYATSLKSPDELPHRRTSRLIVDGRPFFPRLIEHRGESFELLRRLGFNTVYLDHPPTADDVQAAERAGLWLVCPPPHADDPQLDSPRVLGWFCGTDYRAAEHAPDHLEQLRRSDPHRRPLIAGLQQDQWRTSRELDIVLRIREPIGTSFELSHFGRWLQQMTYLVRPGTPYWASIQTELPATLTEQVEGIVGYVATAPRNVQVEQIRQLALSAVAAGSRGLWYRSTTSLEDPAPASELRRLTLELINHELALIEPWVMGGQAMGEVQGQNAELQVISLATERSRLLIPTYVQPFAQFSCRPIVGENTLVIPGVPDSTDAYVINHLGLSPLPRQRISGGLQIVLDASSADSLLLLTEDPLVMTHINRIVSSSKRRVVELEQEISDRLLADFETQAARRLLATPARVEHWEVARSSLRQSRELSQANDLSSAYRFAQLARRELSRLQADVWAESVAGWSHPLWQPTGAAFNLVTLTSADATAWLAEFPWTSNVLRGGECENLAYMVDAGWRQYQDSPADVDTYLALSADGPHGGQHGLRIVARGTTKDAQNSVVEAGPVWVNSAPVTVEAGQRVRISGWIRIDQPIRGALDGCLISDSVSGPDLGLRHHQTHGWERFEMIRTMPRRDHLTITVALFGLGEVWLDDLQIEVESPPGQLDTPPAKVP